VHCQFEISERRESFENRKEKEMEIRNRKSRAMARVAPILIFALLNFLSASGYAHAVQPMVAAGYSHTVGLKSNGRVVAVGSSGSDALKVANWKDIMQVACGMDQTLGLRSDGSVMAVGSFRGKRQLAAWRDIVQLAVGGEHTLGLKSDGTVVSVGRNNYGQRNVGSWTDIIQVAGSYNHSVGLKSDGTVLYRSIVRWGEPHRRSQFEW
jgi:alpha-tubulin suppressor-like RCC1 family protein